MDQLPAWIMKSRKQRGLSVAALARKIGASTAVVSEWEKGTSEPDKSHVDALVKELGPAPEPTRGGAPPWLDEALALSKTLPVVEVAKRVGASPGAVAVQFKKAGVARPAAKPPKARAREGSKDAAIEEHFDLLGKVPDSEIARLADVSVRTVASYRARHNIGGYAGPRRRPSPRNKRGSRLEDFRELLGRVPDRVVAEKAGMSLGAVRNFRIKHNIKAVGRRPKEVVQRMQREAEAAYEAARSGGRPPRAGARAAVVSPPPPPAASPAPARAPSASKPSSNASVAWRVSLSSDGEPFIILAETLVQAVERAIAAAGGDDNRVAHIERLGLVVFA